MAIKKKPVEVPAEVPAEACTWRTIGGALKPGKGPGVVQIFEIRALSCKTYGFCARLLSPQALQTGQDFQVFTRLAQALRTPLSPVR